MSVGDTARQMGLTTARVERLLEEEADRRAIACVRIGRIDNARLRECFLERRRREPALTSTEIAQRVGTSPIQVERWLGLRATAPKTDRRGHVYPGRVLDNVGVEIAGRLARAMGYAPRELDSP